jgi:hypothetical protein
MMTVPFRVLGTTILVTTACVKHNHKTFYIRGYICSGNFQEIVLRKKQLFRPQDPGVGGG